MSEEPKKEQPPLLHRDDVPMDMAEAMVAKIQEIAEADGQGPVKVKFIGDMTDEERAKFPPGMMEHLKKLHDHLVQCFIDGLCHVCGDKFPGEWPPPDSDDEEAVWDLQGWSFYDTDSEEHPPCFSCPACEETDTDGVPKPVILPEIKDKE